MVRETRDWGPSGLFIQIHVFGEKPHPCVKAVLRREEVDPPLDRRGVQSRRPTGESPPPERSICLALEQAQGELRLGVGLAEYRSSSLLKNLVLREFSGL